MMTRSSSLRVNVSFPNFASFPMRMISLFAAILMRKVESRSKVMVDEFEG